MVICLFTQSDHFLMNLELDGEVWVTRYMTSQALHSVSDYHDRRAVRSTLLICPKVLRIPHLASRKEFVSFPTPIMITPPSTFPAPSSRTLAFLGADSLFLIFLRPLHPNSLPPFEDFSSKRQSISFCSHVPPRRRHPYTLPSMITLVEDGLVTFGEQTSVKVQMSIMWLS